MMFVTYRLDWDGVFAFLSVVFVVVTFGFSPLFFLA